MKILLKPYEDLVIAWRYNSFFRARIKLSLLYTLMIASILGVFSLMLLSGVHTQLEEEDTYHELFEDQESSSGLFLEEFHENLLITDLLVLCVSAFLSFFLAGKTLRPIEETLKKHEAFSGNIAHELRTPLSALYASTSAALRNRTTIDEYIETLTDVQHETRRLITLTERLLSTTRGGDVLHQEVLALDELVQRVAGKMHALGETYGVRLSLSTVPCVIKGDALKLEELFFNLIHNAIKFSHRGGEVSVMVYANGVVQIIDNGVGIPPETLPHVFDRFYTSDSSRDERGVRGTGLGLAIASHIAHLHQAKIDITSVVGKGTTVRIEFRV